jgi:CRP-like cAMP-binding protein
VRLLDVEPDLAVGLSDDERADVDRFEVRTLHVAPGRWSPPEMLDVALGIVVLSGRLLHVGRCFARTDMQLFGPGDLAECGLLSGSNGAWRALDVADVAVLDERFVAAARRWPALMRGLVRRLFEVQQEQHTRAAICAMPRVEERLLALMCHLAGRWGRVTADGITLSLPVTHEMLGALIGARRPTVSLALTALDQQQLLHRRPDGAWLLPAESVHWPVNGLPGGRAAV